MLQAIRNNRYVAVRSGHGVGKSHVIASVALHHLLTADPTVGCEILTLAPTWKQVERILWKEIRSQVRRAPQALFPAEMMPPTACWIRFREDWALEGLSPDHMEGLQGRHHPDHLVIVDEAPGIRPALWEAVEALQAKMVVIGNPIRSTGYFRDCWKDPKWHTISISCLEHPNIVQQREVIPGAVTAEWVANMKSKWEGTPLYESRVLGNFPTQDEDSFIQLAWVEDAFKREGPLVNDAPLTLGADIARYGSDRTVFVRARGDTIENVCAWQGQNLMATAGRIKIDIDKYGIADRNVRVDDTGLGGGVTDRLHEQGHAVSARNFGSKPHDSQYADYASELWWGMRERFRDGSINLAPALTSTSDSTITGRELQSTLIGELTARHYSITSNGKIKLESKKDMKKRGLPSPDIGDALALALEQRRAAQIFFPEDE